MRYPATLSLVPLAAIASIVGLGSAVLMPAEVRAQIETDAAGDAATLLVQMRACRGIGAPAARLACYDALSGDLSSDDLADAGSEVVADARSDNRSDNGTDNRNDNEGDTGSDNGGDESPIVAGDQGAARAIAQKADPAETFGADDLKKAAPRGKDAEDESLRASIAELGKTRRGLYVITLDNGQVWRQKSSDSGRLLFAGDGPVGAGVIVSRKLLGGYQLRTEDSRRTIRVERIK